MARLLEKALRRSEAVDREALCLVAGQKVNSLSLSLSFSLCSHSHYTPSPPSSFSSLSFRDTPLTRSKLDAISGLAYQS